MTFDGSYGDKVLLFFGQTKNSAGSGNYMANIRLDKLNLNYTDVSTNTDQRQSVNLLNYEVNGGYHQLATSAKSCYYVYLSDYTSGGTLYTFHRYIVPMVFILPENPTEAHFLIGCYITRDDN